MESIVEEVKQELEAKERKQVKGFVENRLKRLEAISDQIAKLQEEANEIEDVLTAVDEGDFSEALKGIPGQVIVSNVTFTGNTLSNSGGLSRAMINSTANY